MVSLLIVDDNEDIRGLIRTLITGADDTVFECGDGGEALAAYREHSPDWVTMDIELPTQDGLAATREIRAEFPDARILIVTSYDKAQLRESARQAGAFGYLLKENLIEIRGILGHV